MNPIQVESGKGVKVEVKRQELTKVSDAYQNMAAFMQEFSWITQVLDLELGQYGNIIKVINEQQIWDKWQSVKYQLKKKSPDPDNLKPIFDGGDKDYGDPTSLIKNSLVHRFFFPPIIGVKQAGNDFHSINTYGSLPSQLYTGEKVFYEILERTTKSNEAELEFSHKGKLVPDKTTNFKSLYEQNYKTLLGDDFGYNWSYTVDYKFNKLQNALMAANVLLTEATNPSLMHQTRITVSHVKSFDIPHNEQIK
jgi:hypothetical protein